MAEEPKKSEWQIIKASAQVQNAPTVSNSFEADDEFKGQYQVGGTTGSMIEPPYNLKVLYRLAHENNMLPPCIEAMVSNIDGTSYSFRKRGKSKGEDEESDPNIQKLEDLFEGLGLKESFIKLRKSLRRMTEYTGNGYLEMTSTMSGEFGFARVLDSKLMRLLKLDAPILTKVRVSRGGVSKEIEAWVRERRYALSIGGNNYQYFKEYGSSRDLHRETGEWGTEQKPVPADKRASEVLHFRAQPDAHTPYGVPRWISQLPSVLGSRKSEEFNIDFFDNGGVPPVIIFLTGGNTSAQTRGELERVGSGGAMKKNRMLVVELEPGGGTIDKPADAKVTVERFGADRQSDAMFAQYDKDCGHKIKRSFRLPGLFLGDSDDYNFATSHTAYMVAEQQIFAPEREDFDEVFTIQVLPRLGFEGYELISNPVTLKNSELMSKAIDQAVAIGGVSKDALIDGVNTMAGTDFTYSEEDDLVKANADREFKIKEDAAKVPDVIPNPGAAPKVTGKPNLRVVKSETDLSDGSGVLLLAFEMRDALMKGSREEVASLTPIVAALNESDQETFRIALSKMVYITNDPEDLGLQELAGCGASILSREALYKDEGKPDCECGAEH